MQQELLVIEREYTFDQIFSMFLDLLRHFMKNPELIEDPWIFGCQIGSSIEYLTSEQQEMVFEIFKTSLPDSSNNKISTNPSII